MEGITFRRPRIGDTTTKLEMLNIEYGSLAFVHGVLEGARTKLTEGFVEEVDSFGIIVRGQLKLEDVSYDVNSLWNTF